MQAGYGLHLTIKRHDGKPVRCGWDTLQRIKNEYAGKDVRMIEFFPEQTSVVNEENMRHFWGVDESVPLPMYPK